MGEAERAQASRELHRRKAERLDGLEPVQTTGRERLYDSADALARHFTGESLDLSRERARLAREQADAQAMKNERERGEWMQRSEVDRVMVAFATAARDRLLGVPHKTAPQLAADSTVHGSGLIVDTAIREALHDLADQGEQAAERLKRDKRGAKRVRTRRSGTSSRVDNHAANGAAS